MHFSKNSRAITRIYTSYSPGFMFNGAQFVHFLEEKGSTLVGPAPMNCIGALICN
jgi:hypothetical protein